MCVCVCTCAHTCICVCCVWERDENLQILCQWLEGHLPLLERWEPWESQRSDDGIKYLGIQVLNLLVSTFLPSRNGHDSISHVSLNSTRRHSNFLKWFSSCFLSMLCFPGWLSSRDAYLTRTSVKRRLLPSYVFTSCCPSYSSWHQRFPTVSCTQARSMSPFSPFIVLKSVWTCIKQFKWEICSIWKWKRIST